MKITRKPDAPQWIKDIHGSVMQSPVIETISTTLTHDKKVDIVVGLFSTETAKNEGAKHLREARYLFDSNIIQPTYDEETNEMIHAGRNSAEYVMPQLSITYDQVDLLTIEAKVWALMQTEPPLFWDSPSTPRKFREHWQLQNWGDPFLLESVPLNPNS